MTTTFPALTEARGKLDDRRKKLKEIFDQAGPELDMAKVTVVDGDTKAKVDAIRALNTEIDEIAAEVEGYEGVLKAAERARETPEAKGSEPGDGARPALRSGQAKSLGELFTESAAYKNRQGGNGPEAHLDIELKALFETGAGWAPETTRTGRVVDAAVRPIQIIDLVPGTTTAQAAVVYMEETVFVNNAAEIPEGGPYPESQLELAEKDSPVRKIGTSLAITDEQLEDVTQAAGYVNNRLPFMVRQRLDYQLLNGNGTAPNLRGVNNTAGVLTQAKGADPVPDAIYKGIVRVQVEGRAAANAVVMHPFDWMDIRLLRTTDGIYIWGNPSEVGLERIWGLPVARSDAQPENTALVLDTQFTELATRRGIDVQVTNSHADDFLRGKQRVRADVRVAFVIYRPSAICKITGI
jgi:HK97 family phage major capsid protein